MGNGTHGEVNEYHCGSALFDICNTETFLNILYRLQLINYLAANIKAHKWDILCSNAKVIGLNGRMISTAIVTQKVLGYLALNFSIHGGDFLRHQALSFFIRKLHSLLIHKRKQMSPCQDHMLTELVKLQPVLSL